MLCHIWHILVTFHCATVTHCTVQWVTVTSPLSELLPAAQRLAGLCCNRCMVAIEFAAFLLCYLAAC